MDESKEELGVVDGANVGLRDCGYPVLWFGVKMLNLDTLIVFDWNEAKDIICQSGVSELKFLNGKPCVVANEAGLMRFKRWA